MAGGARDHRLLDALEPIQGKATALTVWRACVEGRDPTRCSSSAGRWDDGSFEVLYTSAEREGAIAEMYFHLRRGQPIIPSKVRFHLYELRVELDSLLDLSSRENVEGLGVDLTRFGSLVYGQHKTEYARSQQIGEAARFLDFDGLMVPSARHDCANVVLFCEKIPPDRVSVIKDHGPIDWEGWESSSARRVRRPIGGA
jgi:RES domain-containing protein